MGYVGKHTQLDKDKMAKTWDKVLQLTPESSEYYARSVEKFGKAMADYYWHRRLNHEFDYLYEKECQEIIMKCDKFLKSRGIKTNNWN